MKKHSRIALWSLALLAASCGKQVVPVGDAGGPTTDTGTRTPPPPPQTLTYTPTGCEYEVRTPEVAEAVVGGDTLGPEPTPRFVHASFAGPTDTTFAVSWRTDLETTVSQVLHGTDEAAVAAADGPDEEAGVRAQVGHHVRFVPLGDVEDIRLHEVHVCGLAPATTHYYKVGGPGAWSEVFSVATAPEVGATTPFRFAVTGDARNDAVKWAEVAKSVLESGAELQLFTGDAVALGIHQPDWDEFFGQTFGGVRVEEALASVPMMPANGNHEGLAVNYTLQFAMPQVESEGELAEGEQWYSFDYGNAHFVVLDSSAPDHVVAGAQAEWLEADLAAVDRTVTPWIFVTHHHPPYSCSNHGSDMEARMAWQPIYDRHAVDVVFNGHDHVYERVKPIRGFQAASTDGALAEATADGAPVDGSGTVYVVTGGAGAPLYGSDPSCYHTQLTESVNHYIVVDVEDRAVRVTAYRLDGSTLDAFELTK